MNNKGFFFSLLALIIIVFFFVFLTSVLEKRANDFEIGTDKVKFNQYNEFVNDLSKNYLPSQLRIMVKKVLVNVSLNSSLSMDELSKNITEAVVTGNLSGTVPVLRDFETFNASMSRLHEIWSFMNTYSYTVNYIDLHQEDWQNLTANYSVYLELGAPDLDFKSTLDGEVRMSVFGINLTGGIIQRGWIENTTDPCVLRVLAPGYACAGVNGTMQN